jgi:hypothetical protein
VENDSDGSGAEKGCGSDTAVVVMTKERHLPDEPAAAAAAAERTMSGLGGVYVHRQFGFSYRSRGSCHGDGGRGWENGGSGSG